MAPPLGEITSTFETLSTPAARDGEPLARGTHRYENATVERTYHRTVDGLLAVETVFLRGETTVESLDECWLLSDGRLGHTDEPVGEFCRSHHESDPVADIRFCLEASPTEQPSLSEELTSTFQPASEVELEDGAALRYTGSHEAGDARVERAFFADSEQLRARTVYFFDGERLGSVTEEQALIDEGTFVAATGEPVDAYCRRTHLADPDADLDYAARLGTAPVEDR